MDERARAEAQLQAYFDSMPDVTRIQFFDNEVSFGFMFPFAEKGTGFGEIGIGINKASGEISFDEDGMGPYDVARIFARLIGRQVESRNVDE